MFILLNGSFGIGKTTVAKLLVAQLDHASISDPERIGFVLRRLPPWMLGLSRQPDDYQDLAPWRYLSVLAARAAHRRSPVVVVPMAFTNVDYFNGFTSALSDDGTVHRICLVAPLAIVRSRLEARALAEARSVTEFELRRSGECAIAHQNPDFGLRIDATQPAVEVAHTVRRAVGLS